MDFELSDDQLALRSAARALLGTEAAPSRVRAVVEAGGGYDRALWASMVGQGWPGVAVDEGSGGLGLGMVEAVVLLEEVGAHVAPAPFLQQVVALGAITGTDAGAVWVDDVLAGRAIACVSWSPGRVPVPYAPSADLAVGISAGGDELVVADLRGRQPAAEPSMDRTREVGWLDVGALDPTVIGGPADVAAFIDSGAVAHAAELLGASARMLDVTVEYAKQRVQFDRPIGSFQAVKHRCADMLVDVEGMRSSVYHAAWCLAAGDPDASLAASTAKAWCSDAAARVMASALQVHGGIGFTWAHDLHLYLKRVQLDGVCFGEAPFHRSRLAMLLRPRVASGDAIF